MKFNKILISILLVVSPLILFVILKVFFPEFLVLNNALASLEILYSKYGPFIIFFGGVMESIFLLNFFVPGSVAILLGAALAAKGIISLPAVIFLGTAGLLIGYSFDYLIGRKGWFELVKNMKIFDLVESAQTRLKQTGKWIFFINGVSPNSASIVALAAGIIKYKFRDYFLTALGVQLFWSTFWGIVFYFFGIALMTNLLYWAIFAVFAIFVALLTLGKSFSSLKD